MSAELLYAIYALAYVVLGVLFFAVLELTQCYLPNHRFALWLWPVCIVWLLIQAIDWCVLHAAYKLIELLKTVRYELRRL